MWAGRSPKLYIGSPSLSVSPRAGALIGEDRLLPDQPPEPLVTPQPIVNRLQPQEAQVGFEPVVLRRRSRHVRARGAPEAVMPSLPSVSAISPRLVIDVRTYNLMAPADGRSPYVCMRGLVWTHHRLFSSPPTAPHWYGTDSALSPRVCGALCLPG